MGDWYYLVFSEYTTRTATRYVMSRSPDGPWRAPADNMFDNRAFYAAKTAGLPDGPRYLFGWNPSKTGDRDDGDWQWGGCMTVHELVQVNDGTLAVRTPRTILAAFDEPQPVHLVGAEEWEPVAGGARVTAPFGRSVAVAGRLPASCLIEGTLSFDSTDGEAGVLLNTDGGGAGGYFLRFSPARQMVQFGRIGGYRSWHVDHMPELDRPLPIRTSRPLSYKIIVDGTAVVAYIDDRVALSARMYGRPRGHHAVYADGVDATFTDQSVHLQSRHR
jgi:beta-fructofuranosidase